MNTRAIARIGILAAGLGIGAAFASSPGIASADTTDPFSFDLNDIAISFDGYSLFHEGSATADSGTAGEFNFAFADGDGATGAEAVATGGNYDTAIDSAAIPVSMKKALTLAPTTPFSKAQATTTWHLPSAITTPQAPAASTFSSISPGATTSPPSSVQAVTPLPGRGETSTSRPPSVTVFLVFLPRTLLAPTSLSTFSPE